MLAIPFLNYVPHLEQSEVSKGPFGLTSSAPSHVKAFPKGWRAALAEPKRALRVSAVSGISPMVLAVTLDQDASAPITSAAAHALGPAHIWPLSARMRCMRP